MVVLIESAPSNLMEQQPTGEQLHDLVRLVDFLEERYGTMLKVVRHRDVAFTNCPGAHFLWPENNWPLESPRPSENATGNTFIPCKELIEEAAMLPKFRRILLVNEKLQQDPYIAWSGQTGGCN